MGVMGDRPNLDLLRSIAVGLVVSCHLAQDAGWTGPYFYVEALGSVGVAIFFVHTTLVLMQSLERQGGAAVPFFIRRFFRIYPLAVVTVLLLTLGNWLGGVVPVDRWAVASNLLLVQNITGHPSNPPPLWSLPYEVQMYLFLPALYALTLRPRPVLRVGLLWVASIAVACITSLWGYHPTVLLPCFLPGILAYVLDGRVKKQFSPALLFAVVTAGALIIPVATAAGAPPPALLWALCAAVGVLIPMCRQIETRALAKGAKLVATYSYGIYLTHMVAISFGLTLFPGLPLIVKLGMFAAMLIAAPRVAYRWIEKPGIELGRRLAEKWRQRGFRPHGAVPTMEERV